MQTPALNLSNITVGKTLHGVSWGAILAGAATFAALSLALLVLGVGLGLTIISPWSDDGVSASTLGFSSIVWLILTQLIAAGCGGYLAGRLCARWSETHAGKVCFRDVAHGFLTWAIATLLVAVLAETAIEKTISAGVSTSTTIATSALGVAGVSGVVAAQCAPSQLSSVIDRIKLDNDESVGGVVEYLIDSQFRSDPSAPDAATSTDTAAHLEAVKVFIHGIRSNNLSPQDKQYLAQVVAKRTGMSVGDAEKRVGETFSKIQTAISDAEKKARQVAEDARKAVAYSALWTFVTLLCGALIASFSAAFGARQRERTDHEERTS